MAKAKTKAVPPAGIRGRSPNEWVPLFVKGVFFGEFGVFPSKKNRVRSYYVSSQAEAAKRVKDGSEKTAENGRQKAAAKSSKTNGESEAENQPMFLHVREGKQDAAFALTPEQAGEYADFTEKFKAARGIHVQQIVPGTELLGFAHTNVYLLNPRKEVGESQKFYHALHSMLSSSFHGMVGYYIHGKGSAPVALMAVDDGLVLWQLPFADEMHRIEEVIDLSWRDAVVVPQERELLGRLFAKISAKRLDRELLNNPHDAYLRSLHANKRASGEAPQSSTPKQYPNLVSALEAALAKR